jgi:hypothetical protein
MKKMLITLTLIIGFSITSLNVMAQDPPPPPGGGHGQGNSQPPGGGAPIGSGICVMLIFCATYGGYKIYQASENKDEKVQLTTPTKM